MSVEKKVLSTSIVDNKSDNESMRVGDIDAESIDDGA